MTSMTDTKGKNPIDIEVGRRIRQHRKLLNLTQTDVGEAIGVKFQQVQKYETGANRVSASRLAAIASVLQMQVSEFFGPSSQYPEVHDQLVLATMHAMRDMTPREKHAILTLARSMANAKTEPKA